MNQYAQISKSELLQSTYDILRNPHIPHVLKKDFLKNVTIQIWSEQYQGSANAKIIGNRYMSEEAIQHYSTTRNKKGLHHEHVTTKNLIYNEHFGNHYMEVEWDEIEHWMDSCAFACVITDEENKTYLGGTLRQKMPPEFYDPQHPWYRKKWARYLKAGLTDVWEVEWDEKGMPQRIQRPDFQEWV